jgi:hypothetical protein
LNGSDTAIGGSIIVPRGIGTEAGSVGFDLSDYDAVTRAR